MHLISSSVVLDIWSDHHTVVMVDLIMKGKTSEKKVAIRTWVIPHLLHVFPESLFHKNFNVVFLFTLPELSLLLSVQGQEEANPLAG